MACNAYDSLGEVQVEVLAYLDEHPNAADSVEAIQKWWILQRVSRYSLEIIQRALDQLVAAHLVERRLLGNGRAVYARLPQSKAIPEYH